MRGVIIINGYAKDRSYLYQPERMQEEFHRLGVETDILPGNSYPVSIVQDGIVCCLRGYDFCLFWEKDAYLLAALERMGMPLFNPGEGIRLCDDKVRTCLALAGEGIPMPKTIPAPLCYTPEAPVSSEEVKKLEGALGYPLVVKESYGSLGQGVFLVEDRHALIARMEEMKLRPHLYQEYISSSRGRDVRVIVIGEQVIGGMLRESETDFRSNIGAGGRGTPYSVPEEMATLAVKVARLLHLEYAGVDFLLGEGDRPLVCEVNSNAFFATFEQVTKVNVAGQYAAHIVERIRHREETA